MYIRTLGRLALEGNEFERQKPLLVLAYLAIRGKVARRRLADLFWPHAMDPRDSLITTLRRLKALGPGTIETDATHVWTTAGCDVNGFEAQSGSDRPEAALDLYHGPFLDGLVVPVQEELEEWIYSTRERLAELARLTRLNVATRLLESGEAAAARAMAQSCLDIDHAPAWQPGSLSRL